MSGYDVAAYFVTFVLVALLLRFLFRGMNGMLHHGRPTGSASGAIIGAMAELDKFARPSTEHVREAEEMAENHQDDQGGE